jgi:hypothetical protein
VKIKGADYREDIAVVVDAQEKALQQVDQVSARANDPRSSAFWSATRREMEKALTQLQAATNSPQQLVDALAAEQAAYQALLKLQMHEYEVTRNQNRNRQSGGGREQQMQRQISEMDLTQAENRYETQRQARRPEASERSEDLQVMNRLQELARRQQDINQRLKELQAALQEAKTDQERQEIQRRLKRLQDEERQMLADVDEVKQRMDRPENQSRMSEQRRQLEDTRNALEQAAQAADQNSPSQALASGARAQQQLQDMRDQMRKENSSQFAEDMREMRTNARELSRKQDEIMEKMEPDKARNTLSDSVDQTALTERFTQQRQLMTNLIERAGAISQQAETSEPLLSRELYDTLRKFTQDNAKDVKEIQDQMLNRGMMPRQLYEKLQDASQPDASKMLDITSELLRQDLPRQAAETAGRSRSAMQEFKRGIERAAESVLGDDAEALRLAQQELDQLTDQLQREANAAAQNENATNRSGALANNRSPAGQTNGQPATQTDPTQDPQQRSPTDRPQLAQTPASSPGSGNQSQPSTDQPQPGSQQASSPAEQNQNNREGQGRQQGGQTPGSESSPGADRQRELANNDPSQQNRRGGRRDSRSGAVGGGDGNVNRELDRFLNSSARPESAPITGEGFEPWSDRLRGIEEMLDFPELRNGVAVARERARQLRQDYKREGKKPDWAVVRLKVLKPLVEVRDRIADELSRRDADQALVPIDLDPVPNRYSELVRRYFEELGKDKQ